jgi:hypothetical protein
VSKGQAKLSLKKAEPMNCILHIGAPKTGTSALQDFLADGKGIHDPSVHYLAAGRKHGKKVYNRQVGFRFAITDPIETPTGLMQAFKLDSVERRRSYGRSFFEEMKKELSPLSKDSSVVISDEALHIFSAAEMAECAKSYLDRYFTSVQVVMFIRSPIGYVSSAFSQAVRIGNTSDAATFSRKLIEKTLFLRPLSIWAKAFGRENVSVLWYSGNDTVQSFFDHFDIRHDRTRPRRVNPSMSRLGVEVLLRLNRGASPKEQSYFRKLCEVNFPGPPWKIDSELAKEVTNRTTNEFEEIQAMFPIVGQNGGDDLVKNWQHLPKEHAVRATEAELDSIAHCIRDALHQDRPESNKAGFWAEHPWRML